ncbi:MAG: hypothetical protein II006_03230 [Peptostreptococcaceae bacterium]|jgi:hypothetical protein|nr:hypothetical protein [Peptostreptococcaceae bacterium]MBQ1793647.1 hypothetical protein [Peptostreptococcaceae bacterium]
MQINFSIIFIVMLFVILVSIQYTLNKMYRILVDIKIALYKQNLKDGKYD